MPYAYPPHLANFSYVGKYLYALRFCTHDRSEHFTSAEAVELVRAQFLRAARQYEFEITAYVFMPDHAHLLVQGRSETSNCRDFIRAAKQYSGYYFSQATKKKLWQRYGYEHVLRGDFERATTIRYIVDNPVVAGLAGSPEEYPYLGSERYSISELVAQAAPRS